MPAAAQNTVTIKHLAAAIAEQHEMAKKQSQEILNDTVDLVTKHLKKGQSHPDCRPWNSTGPQAPRSHGTQSRDRGADQNRCE